MTSVQNSDRYKIQKTAFGCVDRMTLDLSRSYVFFKKLQEQLGFKTIYVSAYPFVYVEGNYRRFKYFEKEVTTNMDSLYKWDESFADQQIIEFINDHISDFDVIGDTSNMILSIKDINIDGDNSVYFYSMDIDIYTPGINTSTSLR